jgi:hypothetical protein
VTVREDLAHSEVVRALDEQRDTVDTLQSRAGVLLAAGAIVNVGLGQVAFSGHKGLPQPALSIVGIGAAVVAFFSLLALVWPRAFRLHAPPLLILDKINPFDVAEHDLVPTIVRAMEINRVVNKAQLAKLTALLRVAVVALATNATTWAIVALVNGRPKP